MSGSAYTPGYSSHNTQFTVDIQIEHVQGNVQVRFTCDVNKSGEVKSKLIKSGFTAIDDGSGSFIYQPPKDAVSVQDSIVHSLHGIRGVTMNFTSPSSSPMSSPSPHPF